MNELERARRAAVLVASVHIGGCPACAQSVAALGAARYARRLREQGIAIVAAPRQADVLLLCGTLNERSRAAALALVEETPRPRALVAVGDCAVNGCVFAGSPALTEQPLAATLAVNIEIGGCPPTPEVILDAIAEAQRLLAGEEPDANAIVEAEDSAPGYELGNGDEDGEPDAGAESASEREERP
jgi:Ni,Fe-hydrogenase III small subunit